jgi:DNA polymerase-3 subunit delta'
MNALVGHEKILKFLERAVLDARPAHAYLFTGLEGVGKKLVSVRFACMLNCPDPIGDRFASCPVCQKIAAEKHPDVTVERPEKGAIRIDRIRNIQSSLKYAPVEGNWRVVIIDDAHLINRSAQNALLKTLEEPPASHMLILITANPNLLLSTVRSRCRRIRFGSLSREEIIEILSCRGVSEEKARVLADLSSGSVARANDMDNPNFMEMRDRVIGFLADPSACGIAGTLELSADISGERSGALDAIEIAKGWIRDVLTWHAGAPDRVERQSLDIIAATAQHHSSQQLLSAYEELATASDLIQADFNVNRNLVTDVMLMKVMRILAGPSLGTQRRDERIHT